MGLWTFPVALGSQPGVPVYLLIARGIRADIERGRLLPGASLPGSRTLAKTLGVHRNTVLAAFRELQAEGWITAAGNLTRKRLTAGAKVREWNYTYNATGQVLTIDGPRTDATDVTTLAYYPSNPSRLTIEDRACGLHSGPRHFDAPHRGRL